MSKPFGMALFMAAVLMSSYATGSAIYGKQGSSTLRCLNAGS